MAMGRRRATAVPMFLSSADLPAAPTVPFFRRLNEILERAGFDAWLCQSFHAARMCRPSLAPGVCFRMLMPGCLTGLDSERRIALPACDSPSLREFPGSGLHESAPDHATLSRTRRLLSLEVHERVFQWTWRRLRMRAWRGQGHSFKDGGAFG